MANRNHIPHSRTSHQVGGFSPAITTHERHTNNLPPQPQAAQRLSSASDHITTLTAALVPVYTKAQQRKRYQLWRLNLDFTGEQTA